MCVCVCVCVCVRRRCVRDKAKIEAGEDPEGDGLTDVSDTEDEIETEPWQLKHASSRALSRRLMLRTEVPPPPSPGHISFLCCSSSQRIPPLRLSFLLNTHSPHPCMCTVLCSAQVFLTYCF